jgi:SAM-dependent methyltransferase
MSNTDQIDYWNGDGGDKWVAFSDLLDAMLVPFADAVLNAAKLHSGERVLDVGCGAGALSLKAAQIVGPEQGVVGVDVSEALLTLARKRTSSADLSARFEEGDASQYEADVPFDVLISRFGVMFFDAPGAAFAKLRSNMNPDGRLAFACWQPLANNQWAGAPLQAALPFLTEAPTPSPPGTPGPFAFGDPGHVTGLLEAAGWQGVNVEALEGDLILPGDTPEDAAAFMMKLGPIARLVEQDGADLGAVQKALEQRMQSLLNSDGRVAMGSAVWIVTANAH